MSDSSQPEQAIEITPEMIEAGVDVLVMQDLDRQWIDMGGCVEGIYRAMEGRHLIDGEIISVDHSVHVFRDFINRMVNIFKAVDVHRFLAPAKRPSH